MPLANYVGDLMGTVPRLDPVYAANIVNSAWKDILDERIWSFLVGEGVLLAPQIITSGTVTTVQFSPTVNLDATANAALNNLNQPLITQRQLRVGIGGGSVYNIIGYSNAGATLTLDRPFLEPGGATQQYQCYRCYYQACDMNGNFVTDFLSWVVILNPQDGYAVVGENLRISRQEIDARDPTRGAQDLLYTMSIYKADANGYPIYEAWPHPTSQRGYVTSYRRRGTPLSPTADVPGTFPSNVLVERAKLIAYDWAIVNAGRFPELKGVDWALAKSELQRRYERNLEKAKIKDDELFEQNFLPQLRDYLVFPPIDAAFLQSHDAGSWFDSA